MPSLPRLPVWMPWVAALAVIIAFGAWEWSVAVRESEVETQRLRERDAAIAASQARDEAARERMYDVVIQATVKQQATPSKDSEPPEKPKKQARKPPETKQASLPSTTTALNCKRLRDAYSSDELATMPTFQKTCQ
jgi:cytoskeletal protein RodZ